MRKKGLAVLLSVALMAATLAGCGRESGNPADATVSADGASVGHSEERATEEVASTGTDGTVAESSDSLYADNGMMGASGESETVLPDGTYLADVTLTGGSGKASIESPCEVTVADGMYTADIRWSSPYYDYMVVDGETYYPTNDSGNSCFSIPVLPGEDMAIQADTTAMSQPHLIEYILSVSDLYVPEDTTEEEKGPTPSAGEKTGQDFVQGDQAKSGEESDQIKNRVEEESPAYGETESGGEIREDSEVQESAKDRAAAPPEIEGLTYLSQMETRYAEAFAVYYYEGGYKILTAASGRMYLRVPEGGAVPENLPQAVTVLHAPLQHIYLAASSAMALFYALQALEVIDFSGTEADGWYIEEAAAAMEAGAIRFAGKYSQPDYESLLAGGCDLAVESMMILHTPEVQEKLEALGIPVLIDESSHETHPLGRTEWIRFYGALLDREDEADAFFAEQETILQEMEKAEPTGKTVAYFFVNSAGSVVVRRTQDYIPKMIELAGGTYVFDELTTANPASGSGSVTLSMEEFYAQAGDCDYLIYNAAIESPLNSIDELLDKSPVFADFRAVKEGHVYTTDSYMYQATDILAELIRDIHGMLTDEDDSAMLFLKRVN